MASLGGMQAAVAAGAPGTVEVALEVLAAGGNAVDAAVSAACAMPVTEPGLASLAGGGFMMVHNADGTTHLIDFFAAVPTPHDHPQHEVITVAFSGADQDFTIGPSTVAVPGVLSGLLHAHERHGRLSREEMLRPARALARRGAAMTAAQALVLHLIGPIVTSTREAAAIYAPGGRLLVEGEVLLNDAYAHFLDEIAAGLSRLPAEGPLREADLAAYRVYEREPLRVDLAGGTVFTNPAPSLGGSIIAYALAELPAEPTALDLLTALREATEHTKTTAPTSVRGTTHISVTDGVQTVAMTVSNGSCSGVMLGDTGVQLNNMMGESDLHPDGLASPVGSRIRSMMAPSLVERDGIVTALGTGGSERIRSALTRVIAGLLRGVPLQAAIDAPRVHLDNAGVVQVEPGFPAEELAALPEPVSHWRHKDFYFGGVHAVSSDAVAVADARRGGHTGRL